jgi:2-polyprenyl-3-methyl-5-hydroxy-6-metoxy-1,4-benzoquinol methylase
MSQFIQEVLKYVNKGKVLDLGAGEGKQAEIFFKAGLSVMAVDKKKPKKQNKNIFWKQSSVEEFILSSDFNDIYNVIFMQNVIQFLDKKWTLTILIPALQKHLTKKGIIAIRTFYKNPIPQFHGKPISLYKSNTLSPLFKEWKILLGKQWQHNGQGLDGINRCFYLTDLIVKRK